MGQIKKVKTLKVDVCLQACKEQLSPDKYLAVCYMYVKETSNNQLMHLSMSSRQDFDRSLWPRGRVFELSCCPGGRDI